MVPNEGALTERVGGSLSKIIDVELEIPAAVFPAKSLALPDAILIPTEPFPAQPVRVTVRVVRLGTPPMAIEQPVEAPVRVTSPTSSVMVSAPA